MAEPSTNVDVVYGIEYILFGDKPVNGKFPAVGSTTAHRVSLIGMDSYSATKDDDTTTDVNFEDLDEVFLVLDGEKGKTTITFTSSNFSEATMAYFLGYEVDEDGAWISKPNFSLPEMYMEVKTRKIQNYKAKVFQYLPVKVKATEVTTLTKNALSTIEFEVTLLANTDETGKEIGNKKIIPLTA